MRMTAHEIKLSSGRIEYEDIQTIEAMVVELHGQAASPPKTTAHGGGGPTAWRERLRRWLRPRPAANPC